MRLTDVWERLDTVLGPSYSRSWAHDVVLPELGMTVDQAISSGIDTKEIWNSVCDTIEVPGHLT